jgi:hypothetical protein
MSNSPNLIEEEVEYCTRHPAREATLHCIRCNRPMCTDCVVPTPTGYMCKECTRKQEDRFFTSTNADYPIVFVICAIGNLIGCVGGMYLGGWWFGIFIGGGLGSIFGTLARNATGRRVGRHSAKIAVAGAILGAALAPIPYLLLQTGQFFFDLQLFVQVFGITLVICTVGFALAVYAIYQRRI